MNKARKLRPSQGGKMWGPVGPAPEVVEQIRSREASGMAGMIYCGDRDAFTDGHGADELGLFHDRPHREIGRARAATVVRGPSRHRDGLHILGKDLSPGDVFRLKAHRDRWISSRDRTEFNPVTNRPSRWTDPPPDILEVVLIPPDLIQPISSQCPAWAAYIKIVDGVRHVWGATKPTAEQLASSEERKIQPGDIFEFERDPAGVTQEAEGADDDVIWCGSKVFWRNECHLTHIGGTPKPE